MKKLLYSLLISLGMIMIIPASTFAAAATTDVTGTVTYNGVDVSGATVSVTCDSTTKTTKTDAEGQYIVSFNAKKCPAGATVTASATGTITVGSGKNKTKHTVSGGGQNTANAVNTVLNIATVNISVSLPELGLLTAFGAATMSGGAFYLVRRRNLSAKAE